MSHAEASTFGVLTISGALGRAGGGAPDYPLPLLFSSYSHDAESSTPPMAIARTGGQGGQVYVYADEDSRSSAFAGGGKRWF